MSLAEQTIDNDGASVSLTRIPVEYVDSYWPKVAGFLEKAVNESRGRYDIESLYLEIIRGSSHLWILFEGDDEAVSAFTTQFVHYPLKLNLSLVFLGADDSDESFNGRLQAWGALMPEVLEWARLHGCSGLEIIGRRGWLRVLKDQGFKESYLMIESEV